MEKENQLNLNSKYNPNEAEIVLKWIANVVGEDICTSGDPENFSGILKSGKLLCRLSQKLRPNSITIKINNGSSKFASLVNIENFLAGTSGLVRPQDLFRPSDLVDQKNLNAVLTCLLHLKRATGAAGEDKFAKEKHNVGSAKSQENKSPQPPQERLPPKQSPVFQPPESKEITDIKPVNKVSPTPRSAPPADVRSPPKSPLVLKSHPIENSRLELAQVLYQNEIEKVLSKPKHVNSSEFKEIHKSALIATIDNLGKVRSLTQGEVDAIKSELESVHKKFSAINERKRQYSSPIIGIDLGTTNCCVAVAHEKTKEQIQVVPSRVGTTCTPSYVRLDPNDPVVGQAAKHASSNFAGRTIFDIKRMIGRLFDDENIQLYKKFWPFNIQDEDGDLRVKIDGKLYSPEFIYTKLIQDLKKMAEEFIGHPIVNAVVTIPAHFNSRREYLTKKACYDCGLNVVKVISEPTAAALAYNDNNAKLTMSANPHNSLVFDLGGGTFDVAVIAVKNNYVKVLLIDGDPNLGGQDFDNALMNYCINEFQKKHGINLRDGDGVAKRLRRIKDQCEQQKEYFAGNVAHVTISLDAISKSLDMSVKIDRVLFNSLIEPYLNKCMKIVEGVLEETKVKDIKDVVLVGGSSKIPRVQEILKERFGEWSLSKRVNMDEAVARGAAILGKLIDISGANNVQIQEIDRYLI